MEEDGLELRVQCQLPGSLWEGVPGCLKSRIGESGGGKSLWLATNQKIRRLEADPQRYSPTLRKIARQTGFPSNRRRGGPITMETTDAHRKIDGSRGRNLVYAVLPGEAKRRSNIYASRDKHLL